MTESETNKEVMSEEMKDKLDESKSNLAANERRAEGSLPMDVGDDTRSRFGGGSPVSPCLSLTVTVPPSSQLV